MLVLTRKKGEIVVIGKDIEISVVDVRGESVRIGISAPKSVSIWRKELLEEIAEENRRALEGPASPEALKGLFHGKKILSKELSLKKDDK